METDERLATLQSALQDIRDLKANQWRFSHYGLLIQAALIAIDFRVEVPESCTWEIVLLFLSALTCGSIVWLIHEAQGQIVRWRRATDSLQEPRKETVTEWVEEFGPRNQKTPCRFWKGRDLNFKTLFFGGQVVGAVMAILLIWSGQPPSAC